MRILTGLVSEHLCDELLGRRGDVIEASLVVSTPQGQSKALLVRIASEGGDAGEEDVENDTHRPVKGFTLQVLGLGARDPKDYIQTWVLAAGKSRFRV